MGAPADEELYAAAEAIRAARSRSRPAAPHPSDQGAQSSSDSSAVNGQSAFDAELAESPPSVTSSVREHVYEGGLRYHAYRAGRYPFPNDDVEQNRDDMKHAMTLMLCHGAYFYAPVEQVLDDGAEVLDLGE